MIPNEDGLTGFGVNPYWDRGLERGRSMLKSLVLPMAAWTLLLSAPLARAQSTQPQSQPQQAPVRRGFPADKRVDGWLRPVAPPLQGQKSDPAPKRDLSGIWDPWDAGIQALGPSVMPDDGKPQHRPPFTPLGLQMLNDTKPSNGARAGISTESNDPVIFGDPQGIPREDLFEMRTVQILQTPVQVYMLYEFGRVWRVVWTDGRELPKTLEPRWFGYSLAKWVDDYTFVVETTGLDERTWIDHVGRPHSDKLRVEERFHRMDHDHLELSVTIDDPVMYTKPWVALDRLVFNLEPQTFDVREMFWSPTEFQGYNKLIGNSAAEGQEDKH
jgi:hypothetical protein